MSIRGSLAVITFVFAAVLVPSTHAQNINVKVGFGAPSNAFGAASGQAGVWNTLSTDQTVALTDVQGQPTTATTSHQGCYAYGCSDCPEQCVTLPGQEDEGILLNSWMSPECYAGLPTIGVSGLLPGRYTLHLYAYYGCSPTQVSTHTVRVAIHGGPTFFLQSYVLGGVAWQGTWDGFPYAVATFDVPQGAAIGFSVNSSVVGVCGFQLTRLDDIQSVCPGDGSVSACPCGNSGAPAHGCSNSIVPAGAELVASGAASLANETLVLHGSGMPNASVTYFQGTQQSNGGAGLPFGDGLRCVAGTVVRVGMKINAGNASSYPEPGDLPLSVRGMIPAYGGTRIYQGWYRNVTGPCGSGFNLTNGVQITWVP
jgi:hypothetical protein